jgi:hypothetical protein
MRGPRGRVLVVGGVLVAALLSWGGLDLLGPRRSDLRAFDPTEVARLDTGMWRSYYDRRPLLMFVQLAELMRRQFRLPYLRSYVVAARAIRAVSTTPFDERRAARLELEWWIVHRERAGHGGPGLERALAEAAAALYGIPPDSLAEYGRGRAMAMTLRDRGEAAGGLSAGDWARIQRVLDGSWRALWRAVQPRSASSTPL